MTRVSTRAAAFSAAAGSFTFFRGGVVFSRVVSSRVFVGYVSAFLLPMLFPERGDQGPEQDHPPPDAHERRVRFDPRRPRDGRALDPAAASQEVDRDRAV